MLICRAFIAVEAANHELAISLFREALDICESKEEASVLLTNISLLYHEDKDWDQALDCAEKVCTQCPLPDDDIGVDNLPKNCQVLSHILIRSDNILTYQKRYPQWDAGPTIVAW